MTPEMVDLFGAGSSGMHPVGERIALWLRSSPAKVVACEFQVAVQTAKGWKRGQLPLMGHFTAMVARWGQDFLDYVFAPALADVPDVAHRLERMEKRAEMFARELADLKQQVSDEKMADRRRVGADARGGSAGGLARPGRAGGKVVSRALGALMLMVFLADPVVDVLAAMAAGPTTVADLADQDDDGAMRLPKGPRTGRPVRARIGRGKVLA